MLYLYCKEKVTVTRKEANMKKIEEKEYYVIEEEGEPEETLDVEFDDVITFCFGKNTGKLRRTYFKKAGGFFKDIDSAADYFDTLYPVLVSKKNADMEIPEICDVADRGDNYLAICYKNSSKTESVSSWLKNFADRNSDLL